MAKRIKGITVEIDGSTTGLDKALKGTDANISKVQSSLRDVNRLLKVDPKNTELLAQKQKLLSQAVDETKTRLSALKNASEQAAKTAGNYDAWKAAYTPIQEEIGKTQEKVKSLKEKMAEMEKAGKVDTAEYRALGEELKNEQNHLDTLKQKAKEVDEEFGNPISPEKYDALQREIIETEQNLRDLQEEAKKAASVLGTQLQEAGQKMQEVGDKISSAGKKLMPATATITGIGVASIKTAADFESAMSDVAATMGKTRGEISELEETARKMGETTSFSATESAQGLNILAMSGLEASEQISAIKPVLDLASAGSLSLESAATYAMGAVKGFGDECENTQYYTDLMAKGATLANTDVTGLGEALSGTAATAKGYRQEADSVTLSLLRLAEQNITGSEAATALNRTMADLYTPTDTAKKALDELGFSAYNLDGSARDINVVIDELSEAMAGMSDEEANAYKNTIFTTQGLSAFNKITSTSKEKVEEFRAGLASASDGMGSAAEQAETKLDNLEGQITILKSAVSEAAISIGQTLLPMIKDLVSKIQEWTDKFNSLDDRQKKIIITIAAVVAAIGPVLIIIGTLISSIGTIVSAIGTFISFLGGISGAAAAAGGGIALFSGPLLPIIGIIAGVTAAGVLLYENWDTIKEKASELKERIANKWNEVKESTKETWTETKESTKEAWDNMTEKVHTKLTEISEKTKNSIAGVKADVLEGWTNIKEDTVQKWDAIQNKIAEHGGGIKGIIGTAVDGYKNIWNTGFSAIDTLTGGKLQSAKEKVDEGIRKIKNIFDSLKLKLPEISIPKIKLPHFSISGGFSIKPPKAPSFSVEWYKEGGILSGAQIFGEMGDKLLGGGEAGPEAVLPLNSFYDRLEKIFKKALNITIPDLGFISERELAMNINVYVGNKEFDSYIVKTAEKGINNKQRGNRIAKGR